MFAVGVCLCAWALLAGCMSRTAEHPARGALASDRTVLEWPCTQPAAAEVEKLLPKEEGLHWALVTGAAALRTGWQPGTLAVRYRSLGALATDYGAVVEMEPVAASARELRVPPDARPLQFRAPGPSAREYALERGGPLPEHFPVDALDEPIDTQTFNLRLPSGKASRGIVVWISSLGGQTYERPVARRLRDEGWIVLTTNFSPGLHEREIVLFDEADPAGSVRQLVERSDARLAAMALACEAAVAYVRTKYAPADAPVVVVGVSVGGFVAPAVAERVRASTRAMVLIGAGASAPRVAHTSTFTNGGLLLLASGKVREGAQRLQKADAAQLDAIESAYLAQTRLDPMVLAPRQTDLPILMLHASWDQIVPAAAGERLWRALGKPERWTYSMGHEAMIYMFRNESREIARWISEAAGGGKR